MLLAVGSFLQADFFTKISAGSNPVSASKSPECPPDPPNGHTVLYLDIEDKELDFKRNLTLRYNFALTKNVLKSSSTVLTFFF